MKYERDGCVCHTRLRNYLFTRGSLLYGHNPSARNAMESFHGTAISVIQLPILKHKANDRDASAIDTNSGITEIPTSSKICTGKHCFTASVWLLCHSLRG